MTRFTRSRSMKRAVARTVAFAIMLAALLFYCNTSSSNLSLSQTLHWALEKTRKEVMFLFCNLIMLLVLRDSGLIGPFASSTDVSVQDSLKTRSTAEDRRRTWRPEVLALGSNASVALEEEEEEEEEEERGEGEDASSSDEELDRKFEEFIEKFKRERREEALQLVVAR